MSQISNLSDLSPYTSNIDILNKTAEQLIKDLRFSGIEITFSGNPSTAYEELFRQVQPHVAKLMGSERFFSLLYRIDLSEKQVTDACRNSPGQVLSSVITDLILKRELQKVVMRMRLSENN